MHYLFKVFVHNPHGRKWDGATGADSRMTLAKSTLDTDINMLNINQAVSAIQAGQLNADSDHDVLVVGTQTNLLAYDVENNSDLFYKDVSTDALKSSKSILWTRSRFFLSLPPSPAFSPSLSLSFSLSLSLSLSSTVIGCDLFLQWIFCAQMLGYCGFDSIFIFADSRWIQFCMCRKIRLYKGSTSNRRGKLFHSRLQLPRHRLFLDSKELLTFIIPFKCIFSEEVDKVLLFA